MLRHILGFVSILVLGFMLGLVATAQELLTSDEAVIVTVSADEPATLQFEGTVGQFVSLIAEPIAGEDGEAIDTTLALIAPDDTQLAYNDDTHLTNSETGEITIQRAAAIRNLRLPLDGTYTVWVDSFNGVSEGEAEVLLTVSDDPFAQQTEEANGTTIITLTLPEASIFTTTLALEANDLVTITAQDTSGTLDPFVQVRTPDGAIIVQNDDHDTLNTTLNVLDAQIGAWEVPASGDYLVEVLDFMGRAGTLTLTIEVDN